MEVAVIRSPDDLQDADAPLLTNFLKQGASAVSSAVTSAVSTFEKEAATVAASQAAAAELTAQDALLFYGCAFTAQASQGLAHDVSRQAATLLSHEECTDGHCRATKLGFEWAHVVYFPNLLQ